MAEQPAAGQVSIQAIIERLYENERLTDALTDQAAQLLLGWGEQRLKQLAVSFADPAAVDQAAQHEQQVMRAVNRLAGERTELAEPDFVQRLLELVGQASQQGQQVIAEVNRLAAERTQLSETDFVQRLLELVDRAGRLNSTQQIEPQEKSYDQETPKF